MKEYLTTLIWLIFMAQEVISIKCAECDYLPHTAISGIRTCPKNCYGDICFIVVNNYYNETLISGCVNVDTETQTFFRNHAYCYEKNKYTICGCTTLDRCNSPQAPFSMFTFVTKPFFEECQFVPKHEDKDSNSVQCNITLKVNNSEVELSLKAQSKEGASIDIIEMTTENAHISDSLSITTKSTTFHPTVSYSMKDIEAISDKNKQYGENKNEISGEFVDEVIRSLLPSTDLRHFIDPESNYSNFNDQTKGKMYEKVNIRCDGNSSSSQYGISRIAVFLIFSSLTYFCQLPKVNFKKIIILS